MSKEQTDSFSPRINLTNYLMVFCLVLFLSACADTPIKPTSNDGLATTFKSPDTLLQAQHHIHCNTPNLDALDAVVRVATVKTDGGDGSGVVIGPNLVLTAAHVLEQQDAGLVYIGHQYKKALVVGVDADADLALLAVGTENLIPIKLSRDLLQTHEDVWAVGFPLALHQTTTKGEFFRYRNGSLLTSASIDAGSSGGGLLRCENGQFELAGMIRSYMAYYQKGVPVRMPRRSIAVPVETIHAFVSLYGIEL